MCYYLCYHLSSWSLYHPVHPCMRYFLLLVLLSSYWFFTIADIIIIVYRHLVYYYHSLAVWLLSLWVKVSSHHFLCYYLYCWCYYHLIHYKLCPFFIVIAIIIIAIIVCDFFVCKFVLCFLFYPECMTNEPEGPKGHDPMLFLVTHNILSCTC